MPKFRFDKLVRDKIVAHQMASGAQTKHRKLEGQEYLAALIAKLAEEAQEIAEAPTGQQAEEIADVQQVLDDLRAHLHITAEAVTAAMQHKLQKNGAFAEGSYIEYVEVAEDDPWAAYYRAHPDRYPEIV